MNQAILRDQLVEYFDEGELNNICFDLNIDPQTLPGETKQDQAREMIIYCQRRGLMEKLIARCRELRPNVSWEYTASPRQTIPQAAELKRKNTSWILIGMVGVVVILGGLAIVNLIQGNQSSSLPSKADSVGVSQATPSSSTPLPVALSSPVEQTDSLDATQMPAKPTLGSLPVQFPDGQEVVLITGAGEKIQYEILSAQLEPIPSNKYLLHLHIRAWTDAPSMNFWDYSFRLHAGDISLAPVNELNELVKQDETAEGDIEFEIERTLSEAILVISEYYETGELPLVFPTPSSPTNSSPGNDTVVSTEPAGLPVQFPDGQKVTLHTAGGQEVQYEILSAVLEPSPPNKNLLRLRIRAWTDMPSMNFWDDSFRLHAGGASLAPVNDLNKVVNRDETVDGDIEFEVDDSLTEAVLAMSGYGDAKELRLMFP
jgi:hypothetical protein